MSSTPPIRDIDFSSEFTFRTSRSGGSGGQHVNKVETQVELRFAVNDSALLSDAQKARINEKLANRINKLGELVLKTAASRSQAANKEHIIERFYSLLEEALTIEKKRRPTRISRSKKENRLKSKKLHSQKKQDRKKNWGSSDS